ncbi:MAG: hypothetical protein J6B91_03320 [Prevotella sp.]|nr:hypothetical protein [Prevotella sp.]
MKKILFSMLAITMAAFTFTSCEDVPEPYEIPGQGGNNLPDGIYLNKDFSSSLDGFTQSGSNNAISWIIDYSSACITGYKDYDGSGSKYNQAGVTYLISEAVDLTNSEKAYIEINHALNYEKGDINTNNSVLISKNYNGDANAATWEQLSYDTEGLNSGFTFMTKGINIPQTYIGGKVYIALRHTCSQSYSSTWEVKSLSVKEGEVEVTVTPPAKDGVFIDQDFSTALGTFTSVSSLGNCKWTIDYQSACITGYKDWNGDGTKTNEAGVTYLVSPEVELKDVENAYLNINQAINYIKDRDLTKECEILICQNYTNDVNTATWEVLPFSATGLGTSFNFTETKIDIPAAYIGKKVVIALRHTCDNNASVTWEVKSLKLLSGKAGDTPGTDIDPNAFIVDPNSFGLENSNALSTLTLTDGTTLTFSKGDGATAPAYYTGGGGSFRIYPQNTIDINAVKAVKSITVTVDIYNGITCNAEEKVTCTSGTVSFNDATVKIESIGTNKFTIKNANDSKGTASQFRIKSMAISYAE